MTEPQPPNVGGNPEIRTYSKIAAALVEVQRELPVVERDQSATVKSDKGQYSYTYADLTSVSLAIYPRLTANGLAFTAFPTIGTAGRYVLRYLLLHASGEYLDGEFPLPADSKSPQAMGSMITYARRYALCAVTGVTTADDDGAAAEYSTRQQAAAETVPPVDNEQLQAIGAVQGVWQMQYGPWTDKARAEAGAAFGKWSGGEDIRTAQPARLRAFAAYLASLPPAEAGSDPAEPPAAQAGPAGSGPKMNDQQRGKIFALLGELGIDERQEQLDLFSRIAGRVMKSRSEVTFDEAKVIINKLQEGDVPVVDSSPRMIGRGDLRALDGLFKQLAIDDPPERLHIASSLVGHEPTDKASGKPSATGLTAAEGKTLLIALADCKTRDDVEALIVKVEQERAEGGEQDA